MSKRAFLVLGPESSGTRFLTHLCMEAGCQGDSSHEQKFDKSLNDAGDLIVWRRSLPYGRAGGEARWPDLHGELLEPLRSRGYEVRVFAMIRSFPPLLDSQIGRDLS